MTAAAGTPVPPGRFLSGPTMGHVVRMTMTGAMGITFVFIVDAANLFWLSQLGEPMLVAAIGFAFAIQFFSVSAGIGLMIASTALVSRYIGAGDREGARITATSGACMAFCVQAVVAVSIISWRHEILAISGATGETAALAARYLALSMPSITIMAIGMAANGALRAHGDGARSMYVTLTSGCVSMLVDPVVIYGLGLGLDGAAIAVTVSRVVMLVMGLRFAIFTHDLFARPRLGDIPPRIRPYAAIAVPAILTQLATPTGNYLVTNVMARFGDDAVAGWAVVGRLTVVVFGGIFSLSGAIGGIFGQNYGAGLYDRIERTYRDALIFGLIYTLVAWALVWTAAPYVIAGFGLTPAGAEVVHAFATVGVGGFLFASALFVSNAAFNALGKPARSTLVNWLRDGAMTLPLALLLAGWYGASGAIYAQAVASALVGSLAALWGWLYVRSLSAGGPAPAEIPAPRSTAHADRFRRR